MNGNLYELLRSRFSGALDRQCLIVPGTESVTYGSIDDRSARFAAVLRSHGVLPGDRVVVQTAKSIDAVALYLGCLRVGAVYVPLNTSYVAAEVAFFLADAEPALFVHEPDQLPPGTAVDHATMSQLSAEADVTSASSTVEIRLADDLAAILYTSGTTGRSKGAMLTHSNLACNALTLHAIWRFEPDDVLLHVLPIFHVHGLFVALHTALLNASPILFMDRFSVDTTIESLREATVMMGVPTHYARLLDDTRFTKDRCQNMRLFISGSAPMTEIVHNAFTERTGHRILERYGMTEAGMITSNPYDGERVPGTVGFGLPGVDVRVVDETGRVGEPGEIGGVEVRGPNVFVGYWRLPERTEAAHREGWFITGDVGSMDDQGRLSLQGRAGDMIISGGLNIYPREIELVIDEVVGVAESAVVGVPDDDLGESVVAVVVSSDHRPVVEAAIGEALDRCLASFKHPKLLRFVEELPRNSMGKVQKSRLREVLTS